MTKRYSKKMIRQKDIQKKNDKTKRYSKKKSLQDKR